MLYNIPCSECGQPSGASTTNPKPEGSDALCDKCEDGKFELNPEGELL